MILFNEEVGFTIVQMVNAYDAMLFSWQEEEAVTLDKGALMLGFSQEEEAAVVLHNRTLPRVPIRTDDRYYPLKETESRVHAALEDPRSRVILLYGGHGKGKSTVVRQVAVHYQRTCKEADPLFDEVVFLECGPGTKVLTSQLDLVQLLGLSTTALQEQGQTGSDVAIRKELLDLLKERRILILFDNVWHEEFLEEMLNLCGDGVKCLVTSQLENLCQGLRSGVAIQIPIEDVQLDVAMKILASHVGFADRQIPKHIQGQALKLIEYTEQSPLAMACVATAIEYNRSNELSEWEAVSYNLSQLFKSPLGMKYPKSLWLVMQFSTQSLREEAHKLLILLYMCDGPSVAEEVLQSLYLSAVFEVGCETFEKSRKDLESQDLVKITCISLQYDSLEKERSWSLHSLAKLFIEEEMKENSNFFQLREMMLKVLARHPNDTIIEAEVLVNSTRILSAEDDAMVQISLCALYFDEQFCSKIKSKIGILPNQLNNLRRNAI